MSDFFEGKFTTMMYAHQYFLGLLFVAREIRVSNFVALHAKSFMYVSVSRPSLQAIQCVIASLVSWRMTM